ncbi:ABC transporter substrate-binding protein, partial [Dehalococcoidia bacterium]|nr:ABC transporter substrate-binding protein [Dehalococcoidia bacterium]
MLLAQKNNSFYQIGFWVIVAFLVVYSPACTESEETTAAHTVTPVASPTETIYIPTEPTKPTAIPSTVPTKAISDSWQTYENTTWGVSLQFPLNWIPIDSQSVNSPLINLSAPTGFPQVQLYKEIPPTLTTAVQLAQRDLITIQDESSTSIVRQNQIQVHGASSGYQIQLKATGNDGQTINFRLIYATRGTHAFTLWIKSLAPEDTANIIVIENIIENFSIHSPHPFDDSTANTITLWAPSPLTLDPALSGDAGSHRYIQQIFSGLVRFNHDLEVVPDIATWNVSADRTIYTFSISTQATFHNGKKVTADDFIYSLNRAANPSTGSTTALDFLGDIAGVQQVINGEARHISGLTKIDTNTLQIQLVAPTPYFLQKMTYPAAFVVDKNNVESGHQRWWLNPVGTGPFQLQKWTANEILVLAKHNGYYGYKANLDNVAFRMYGENPLDMYKEDEIDVVGVSFDMLPTVNSNPNFRRELVQFAKPS